MKQMSHATQQKSDKNSSNTAQPGRTVPDELVPSRYALRQDVRLLRYNGRDWSDMGCWLRPIIYRSKAHPLRLNSAS